MPGAWACSDALLGYSTYTRPLFGIARAWENKREDEREEISRDDDDEPQFGVEKLCHYSAVRTGYIVYRRRFDELLASVHMPE